MTDRKRILQPAYRAAEFFAGIGLVRLALERKGWNVVFANDIDAEKAEMYRTNWPKDKHLCVQDIHLLNADEVPTCELFTASFPCNDLSIAGRWEGLDGKESSAFWGLIRVLRDLGDRRPPLIMIENVVGFLMSKNGRDFEKALLALNELGYVVDAFILNAVHWVPQSRSRRSRLFPADFTSPLTRCRCTTVFARRLASRWRSSAIFGNRRFQNQGTGGGPFSVSRQAR
jgi:DNA-cytosine methyltransferase